MARRGQIRENDINFTFGSTKGSGKGLKRKKKKRIKSGGISFSPQMALAKGIIKKAQDMFESDEDFNKRKDANENLKKRYVESFNGYNQQLARGVGLPHPAGRVNKMQAQSLTYGQDDKLLQYGSDVVNRATNFEEKKGYKHRAVLFKDIVQESATFGKYKNNLKKLLRELEKASGVGRGQLLSAKEIKFNVVYYMKYRG